VKQLVVLSGKGGTGKTAVTAALAHQASRDPEIRGAVVVDADVDAANLELVVKSSRRETHRFFGNEIASIDPEGCIGCGICEELCRFDAISPLGDGLCRVDPLSCEGCAVCFYHCPVEAVSMVPRLAGQWFRSESRYGPFFHARLRPAQENSGKLVSLVKENARKATLEKGYPLMIVDGPPGIACPAIAAATGADMALIVTEPTVAGLHDLERAGRLAAHFKLETLVCINKEDLNPHGARLIEEACERWGVRIGSPIPFDESVTWAMVDGQPVTEFRPESPVSHALQDLWEDVKGVLGEVAANRVNTGCGE
jgi:MinD superfamily P-loop ATPase